MNYNIVNSMYPQELTLQSTERLYILTVFQAMAMHSKKHSWPVEEVASIHMQGPGNISGFPPGRRD